MPMIQNYNFINPQNYISKKSRNCQNQPSKKVIQTILSYARSTQRIKVKSNVLDYSLN